MGTLTSGWIYSRMEKYINVDPHLKEGLSGHSIHASDKIKK